jgi:hypothetical protein
MILGSVTIDHGQRAVHTHRDSYLIDNLSVVSVRRPLLPMGMLFGPGLSGFALMFGDLLFIHEIGVTVLLAAGAVILGLRAGQLKLLSRDLRGSELAGVIWGDYGDLNALRKDIAAALTECQGAPR